MKRLIALVLLLLSAGILLAACGGGGSSSSSTTAEAPATEEKASTGEEASEPPEEGVPTGTAGSLEVPPETQPVSIPAEVKAHPLPKAPPKGINVVNMQCDFETCKPFSETFQEAAKALGWKVKTIVFKTGQPQAALTQAINTPGTEYITIAGIPKEIIEPQFKAAEEKGIKLISCCDPGPAVPPTMPVQISGQVGNQGRGTDGIAAWVIQDSKETANVAVIGLPEIPITAPTPGSWEKALDENCPGCKYVGEIPITGEELAAGSLPAKVVAFLQAHPEVNYLAAAFGNLTLGVPEALKTAGLADKVKFVGQNGIGPAESEALARGELVAFYAGAQGEWGTLWADTIARESMGLPLLPESVYNDSPQRFLCTPKTAKECTDWNGPPNLLKEYEEVWKVG